MFICCWLYMWCVWCVGVKWITTHLPTYDLYLCVCFICVFIFLHLSVLYKYITYVYTCVKFSWIVTVLSSLWLAHKLLFNSFWFAHKPSLFTNVMWIDGLASAVKLTCRIHTHETLTLALYSYQIVCVKDKR